MPMSIVDLCARPVKAGLPGRFAPVSRSLAARVLVVLACVVLLLALIAGYARLAVVDSDQFANRATAALRDDSVKTLIAERITDDVVLRNEADLLAARPIIQSVAEEIVGGRAFTALFRVAVRDVHRAVFNRDKNTVTLTVGDVGTVLAAALEKLRPSLANQLEKSGRVTVVKRDVGSLSASLARFADAVRVLAPLLIVLSVLLAAAAIAVSVDRRRTVVDLGIGIVAAALLLILAYEVLRSIALNHVQGAEQRAAAAAVWDAFLADFRTGAWIVAGSGAVIAAAAASLIRPVDLREPLGEAFDWVTTEPQRPAMRVLRGVSLVAAGVLVIVERDAVLRLLVTVAGVVLVYAGVAALLRLIYRPQAPGEERRAIARRVAWIRREHIPAAIAAAVIAIGIAVYLTSGGATTAAPAADSTCNGYDALCDKPLDEVVLPATHNSMSVPLPGWYSAEQEAPIANQLADGIRGLLIDTHYADKLPNGKLRTYFGSEAKINQLAKQDGVSQDAVDAALRIRDRLGFEGQGERGMYLCHTFCELGATKLSSVLDDMRDFLVSHPAAVVVAINQDYVTPADFVGAVDAAGLDKYVYRGPTGKGKWLTLREMIDSNQRIVFMAENHAGAASWYHPAYKAITEETPYTFKKVALLTDPADLPKSCKPNRGPEGAPMFLINHWISTDPVPLPSHARQVNAYKPLLARAQECQRIRHHLPNLLAVNFYREGDLFAVVNKLNGVR
jgi:hypothetical protein